MWEYTKMLQYPVNIKHSNPRLAKFIITQYGRTGWGASERHLDT